MIYITLATIIIIFGIDMLTKYLSMAMLSGKTIYLLGDIVGLTYTQNDGGPYGIFGGNIFSLVIVSIICVGILVAGLIYCRKQKRYYIPLAILLGAAAGNLFDRIVYGYVRDMLLISIGDFALTNFICNFADIMLWVGVIWMLISLITDNKKKDNAK